MQILWRWVGMADSDMRKKVLHGKNWIKNPQKIDRKGGQIYTLVNFFFSGLKNHWIFPWIQIQPQL